MSFTTSLSGLLGAQDGLSVAGNDLANANTTGFKAGSALFEDLYPGNTADVPGDGTVESGIQQDYSQGNLQTTNDPYNLAIKGNGFFVVRKAGQDSYTRDGAFRLSSGGELQTADGSAVVGYGASPNGTANGILSPIVVPTENQSAKASSTVSLSAALNTADPVVTAPFNAKDNATYDESTSVVAYDSLGNANHVQLYFAQNKPAGSAPGTWSVYAQPQNANGSAVGSAAALTTLGFSPSGALTSGSAATLAVNWGNGAAPSNVAFNFKGTTLGAQSFAVDGLTDDGYAPGQFTGATISATGQIEAQYSNGQKATVGTVALATFINDQGLVPLSQNLYATSESSGQPLVNVPGAGTSGTLIAGSLEDSNVQTSNELVELLNYQEAYQANTSALQGNWQDTQKLLQLV